MRPRRHNAKRRPTKHRHIRHSLIKRRPTKHQPATKNEPMKKARKTAQPIDGKRTLSSRKYFVSNYKQGHKTGDSDILHYNQIPMEECKWEVPDSCWSAALKPHWALSGEDGENDKWTTQNGLKEMFHFRYHPEFPVGTAAVRRIPCLCDACYKQLAEPWKTFKNDWDNRDYTKQPKFQNNRDCRHFDPMDTLNDWNFVTTKRKKGFKEEQMNIVLRDLLHERETKIMGDVTVGKLGAVLGKDKAVDAPDE